MVRILMTGCTALHVNGPNKSHDYVSPFNVLKDRVLPALGHDVTWGEEWPGTPIKDKYDVAIVGVAPFSSLNTARYKFSAVWAASQLPTVIVIDDMQWSDIWSSLMNQKHFWKSEHLDGSRLARFEAAKRVWQDIERVRTKWSRGFGTCLFTMFEWGDKDFFRKSFPIKTQVTWDPSELLDVHLVNGSQVDKRREWSAVSLSNHSRWLQTLQRQWPTRVQWKPWIGEGKKLKAKEWRLPEDRIVKEWHAPSWGSLAYFHQKTAGSGWWRARFNHVIEQAQSVFWSDPREVSPLGEPFLVPIQTIEDMSENRLQKLADEQLQAFAAQRMSSIDAIQRVQDALEQAVTV